MSAPRCILLLLIVLLALGPTLHWAAGFPGGRADAKSVHARVSWAKFPAASGSPVCVVELPSAASPLPLETPGRLPLVAATPFVPPEG